MGTRSCRPCCPLLYQDQREPVPPSERRSRNEWCCSVRPARNFRVHCGGGSTTSALSGLPAILCAHDMAERASTPRLHARRGSRARRLRRGRRSIGGDALDTGARNRTEQAPRQTNAADPGRNSVLSHDPPPPLCERRKLPVVRLSCTLSAREIERLRVRRHGRRGHGSRRLIAACLGATEGIDRTVHHG